MKYAVLFLAFFFVTTQRAPAPIQEIQESPTPASTAKAKTKSKATSSPNESSKSDAKKRPAPKTSRFAGKWIGIMPEVPWGNMATELTVDPSETTMHWTESGKEKGTGKATINGDTIQASFVVGVSEIWSLTPMGDGSTARVRLQAFMNDQNAVFHRVAK